MAGIASLALECDGVPAAARAIAATVHEAISRATYATVELLSVEDFDLHALLGKVAHLSLVLDGTAVRHFQLVVSAARYHGPGRNQSHRYVLELSHRLAQLATRSDVRMFQEKDAKAIVSEVLEKAGVEAATTAWSVQRTLTERVYCVQYRESDLAFVSRLLEHEGIFFFIRDDESATQVTFADAQSAFEPIEGRPHWPVLEGRGHGHGVMDLELESVATAERVSLGDYNFETPNAILTVSEAGPKVRGDVFEYAASHASQDEGAALAKLRLEEMLVHSRVGRGSSDRHTFRAGSWFELEGCTATHLAQKYLLTAVTHLVVAEASGDGGQSGYENRFTCVPHALAFRPPRSTPIPRLRGMHSVVVTGPGGEIHTDEHGRMKGKFFWDRVGKDDDTSSCWMRLAQLPIGGSMALARMTWEMSVCYFDGDPDRPIAVSRLYNAEKTSPYSYPAAGTRMSLQTPSSPASGKSNEIRMEDGGGGQEFFVNASKDYNAQTNNNKTEDVGVDETIEVGVADETTVGASQTVSIGGSQTTKITGNESLAVTGDRSVSIGASETVSVSGNIGQVIAGSDSETTGGSHTTLAALGVDRSSTGTYSLTVGGSMISVGGMGCSLAVAGARSETIGGAKIFASGATVTETIVGAYACTVGGAVVHGAAGNRVGGTKGAAAITVGGVVSATAGGKVNIKAKKVSILVGATANLVGGGGVLNLTPGSAAFVGTVTLDASGAIKISGNPNLVG